MYLASEAETFPVVMGGNAGALSVLGAWAMRDLRDRREGEDTESDLFGVIAIAVVLALMPLLEVTADVWAGITGAAIGCMVGLLLPKR
jgi:hypothetical protein